MKIGGPGLYPHMDEADYHADPAPEPSLSAHDADTLLSASPLHTWTDHPRLNPVAGQRAPSADMLFGQAAHALLAGQGEARIVWIDAKDYRTNAAKDARDAAIRDRLIPLLLGEKAKLHAMRDAVIDQAGRDPQLQEILQAPGDTEVAAFAQDRGVWVRALFDWMPRDPAIPSLDYKLTKRGASREDYERPVQTEHALRLHHYARVRQLVHGIAELPPALLAVIEVEEPYGMVLHGADDDLAEYAAKRWEEAFQLWWRCLSRGTERPHWPGYPPGVIWHHAARWQSERWEVELEEMQSRRSGMSIAQANSLAQRMGGPIR
jgi:hypothetical protein